MSQIPAAGGAKRKTLARDIKRDRYLYLFLLPGVLWFLVYRYAPMAGLVIAFKEFSFSKGLFGGDWVGLKYFKFILFTHRDFFRILRNTLLINAYELVFSFPAPILLALMLNEIRGQRLMRVLQTVIYFPHFVSWVVFGGIVIQFLSPTNGIVNELIKLVGGQPIFFMTEERFFRGIVVASGIWKNAGWGTIIYLAAITGVDLNLYDAATMDGAGKVQTIRHVTLPAISQTIIFLLLMHIGRIMDVGFEPIYVLSNPSVYSVGDVISTYVFRVGIGNARFSLTTTIGLFQSVVGLVLIVSCNALSRRLTGKSIW